MSHGAYSFKRRKKDRRQDPEKLRYMSKTWQEKSAQSKEPIALAWNGQRLEQYIRPGLIKHPTKDKFNWRRGGGDRRTGERRLIPSRPVMYTPVDMDSQFCAIRQQYLEQPWNYQAFRSHQDKVTTTHSWRR